MVRVDGGYIVLNYIKYRDRDYTAAARAKRYRDRQKDEPSRRNAVTSHRNVTQAEEEADKEVHPTGVGTAPEAPAAPRTPKPDPLAPLREEILTHWRAVAVPAELPDVLKGTVLKLKSSMNARLKDPEWLGLFREAVDYAARHPGGGWMRGESPRAWKVSLDWLLKPGNTENIAAKARAAPGRPQGMAADATTQRQIRELPRRTLPPPPGAP